jgi:hypothetical protein
MAVRISGDFGKLEELIAKVRTIASPTFREATLTNLAEAARTEIVLGFAGGRDPLGRLVRGLSPVRHPADSGPGDGTGAAR